MTTSTTKEEFVKNIQKWVAIDTQLHDIHNKTKILRETRKELSDVIHRYVENNRMENTIININDGELRFCDKKEYHGLTFAYIEQCLNEYFLQKYPASSFQTNVPDIMQYIRMKRSVKTVKDIHRSYSKQKDSQD
jgi:septum formation topological specificity factor MinE